MVNVDDHGWKRSDCFGSDFELTDTRKALMKQAIAYLHCEVILHIAQESWHAGAVVTRDVSAMMEILATMTSGNMRNALDRWSILDPAARAKYPIWVQEMAGQHISPEAWDDEESLENTR